MFTHFISNAGGWDLSKGQYSGVSESATLGEVMHLMDTGVDLYIGNDTTLNKIEQYELTTPWKLSTKSLKSSYTMSESAGQSITAVRFKPDRTKMYGNDKNNRRIWQYSLSDPDDISTASYDSKFIDPATVNANLAVVTDMWIMDDGTTVYLLNIGAQQRIYQCTLLTPWDISTMTDAGKNFVYSSFATSPDAFFVRSDGVKFYIVSKTEDAIFQCTMSTAKDMSTGSYESKSLDISSESGDARALDFMVNGKAAFIGDTAGDTIYRYSL